MMKLKVGDQVKFLNDTGGGKVTKIISKDMVQVLNEDGFEVPVLADELLRTGDEQHQEVYQQEQEEEESYNSFEESVPDGNTLDSLEDPGNHVYFAFVPIDESQPGNNDLEAYLINDSDFFIHYLILLRRQNMWVYFASGDLEDNMKIHIKDIEKEHFNEIGQFRFQFIFYQKGFYNPVPPVEIDLNVHPRKFFKSSSFIENDFFDEQAMVVELRNEEEMYQKLAALKKEEVEQVIREKDSGRQASRSVFPREKQPDTEEVDLHIEELVERPKELSNQEMLEIQMSRFQTALEGALNNPSTRKIVFIHGVGNGRLRYEIRNHLDRHYPKLDYQDASFKEYGYGATLVFTGK